jgi:hypothetical protein
MVRLIKRPILACSIILMAVSLVSCSGGGNPAGGSTGFLELSLIDSPIDYDALFITINEVQVHHEITGWQTLSELNLQEPINLLELRNGTMYYLGSNELATGHYDQMRLILDDSEGSNYLFKENGEGEEDNDVIPLKVPSGGNTGIKLVNGFDIDVSGYTELILDFEADKSVVEAGKSGQWLLKPTIKVVESVTNSVSGTVENTNAEPLSPAGISAQKYQENLENEDRVLVASSTHSSDGPPPEEDLPLGEYFLYLPLLAPTDPPYNIVATMEGYAPACQQLPSNDNGGNIPGANTVNFILTQESTGSFAASVQNLAVDEEALFSIRQFDYVCGEIEVASFELANTIPPDYSSEIILPVGDYHVVVSADGQETKELNFTVNTDELTMVDVSFP